MNLEAGDWRVLAKHVSEKNELSLAIIASIQALEGGAFQDRRSSGEWSFNPIQPGGGVGAWNECTGNSLTLVPRDYRL